MTVAGETPTTGTEADFLLGLFKSAVEERRLKHAGTLAVRLEREHGVPMSDLAELAGVRSQTVMGWFYLWYRLDKESKGW